MVRATVLIVINGRWFRTRPLPIWAQMSFAWRYTVNSKRVPTCTRNVRDYNLFLIVCALRPKHANVQPSHGRQSSADTVTWSFAVCIFADVRMCADSLTAARSFRFRLNLKPSRKQDAYSHAHDRFSYTYEYIVGAHWKWMKCPTKIPIHITESRTLAYGRLQSAQTSNALCLSYSLALYLSVAPTHPTIPQSFWHYILAYYTSQLVPTRVDTLAFMWPFPLHILSSTRRTTYTQSNTEKKRHTRAHATDRQSGKEIVANRH